eukprot:scaffold6261_cov28-Tisochrysis_lutea.AAC.4
MAIIAADRHGPSPHSTAPDVSRCRAAARAQLQAMQTGRSGRQKGRSRWPTGSCPRRRRRRPKGSAHRGYHRPAAA